MTRYETFLRHDDEYVPFCLYIMLEWCSNVAEAVYLQHLMGIDGVIVDLVQEITEAVSDLIKPSSDQESAPQGDDAKEELKSKPKFTQQELSFLLKLIPKLIQL